MKLNLECVSNLTNASYANSFYTSILELISDNLKYTDSTYRSNMVRNNIQTPTNLMYYRRVNLKEFD